MKKPPAPTHRRDTVLGERLRAMRHRHHETQRTFCRHFPVARQTYVGWERSGVPPGPTSLMVRLVLRKLSNITPKSPDGKRDPNGKKKKAAKDAGPERAAG